MYIKRDLYLTKTPFKITYEFKWLPIQGIYLVHLFCSNYDGKFKSVGCNKFTLFPILGVERSFPFPGKGCNWERFLSQQKAATGKGFINFGKAATGKGNFPKTDETFLRKGVVCNWERFHQFWERILSFPRKGVVCNWERFHQFGKGSKGERKGFIPSR